MLPDAVGPIAWESLFAGGDAPPSIEAGTIGWDGDADHVDLGTDANDGVTLVKVQLFRGKDPTEEAKPGVAQGTRILARLSGFPFWCVPPQGMQCFVAFPGGFATTPGAGVIVALPGANPFVQFNPKRAKLDVGKDMDLVIKARSIVLTMHAPDGGQAEDFISMSPEGGIQAVDRKGNGLVIKDGEVVLFVAKDGDAKTLVRLTQDSLSLAQKDGSKTALVQVAKNMVTALGGTFRAMVGNVALGTKATPATPVAIGPQPGLVSKSVFAQP